MKKTDELNCILLVDDNKITNFIQAREIEKVGLNVHLQVADSGKEGLDYLRKTGKFLNEPDLPLPGLILLDLNMPGINGWEFIEAYKNLPQTPSLKQKLYILTTSSNPEDRKRAERIPEIGGFLRKPLTAENIKEIIKKHFSN